MDWNTLATALFGADHGITQEGDVLRGDVRFDGDDQVLTLRRGTCTLHGSGVISLGAPPNDPTSTQIRFDVLSFSDTLPQY